MSENTGATTPNEREGRILEILRNSLDHKLNLIENESSSQSQILAQFKKELDDMIEFGTQALSHFEEKKVEEPVSPGKKTGLQIEVDGDSTPSSKGGQKVPQSTKEKKTGLLDGKPNPADRRNSEVGKSDKTGVGAGHPAEESKTNPPNKPEKKGPTAATPKGNTKADKKDVPEKPGAKNPAPTGKKPAEVKKNEPTKPKGPEEEKKEEKKEENTPEQAAIKESLSAFKTLSRTLINDISNLINTPTEPAVKVSEAVCVLLGEKTDVENQKKLWKGADLVKKLTNLNSDSVSDENFYKAKELLKGVSETAKSKNAAVTACLKWANRVLKQIEVKRGLKVEETQPESEVPVNGEVKHEEKTESAAPQAEEESKEGSPSTAAESGVKEGIISKEEIAGLKAKKNPPAPVGLILDATCAALKLVPKQVGAKKTYDHVALLNMADLEAKVNGFDITTVPKDVIKKIREFADKPDFKVEKVQSLPGAVSLCKWIQSIVEHDKINSPPEETAPKDTKTPATGADKKEVGKKPATPAPVKKEEKKVEEKKVEKKEEKKPAPTPVTNKKAPAKEEKKEDKVEGHKDLTQILNKVNKNDVTSLSSMSKPPENVLLTVHALSLLIENKEHPWDQYKKSYLKSHKDFTDKLTLDVSKIPQANVEAVQKFITTHKLTEEVVKKTSAPCGHLLHFVQTAIKLSGHGENKEGTQEEPSTATQAENKENESQASNTNPAVENKEEKIPEVTEVKQEEKPAEAQHEEKPVEAAPQEEKAEAPQQEVVQQEESHPEVTQPEVTHATEVQAPVEEQVHVEQSEHREEANGTQEKQEVEPQPESVPEVHQEEQKVEEVVQEKVEEVIAEVAAVNGEQQHQEAGNTTVAGGNDEEVIRELSELLGEDVSSKIGEGGVREFIKQQATGFENQIAVFNAQNEDYKKEGVPETPEKKPYEIKESTKGFIGMVEQAWVSELLHKPEWDEKISQIMTLFFLIQGYTDVPPLSSPDAIKNYASDKLQAHEENIVEYLMAIEKKLDLDIELKMRIQDFLQDKSAILTATTFDGVDGFCGMISFLLKETCEYLGVIPKESAKKVAAKEKIYLLNVDKIDYYNQKQTKVIEVAHKYGIPLDS